MYDFITKAVNVAIFVDCENVDPYHFASALKNLEEEKIQKIKKVVLFDDVNTTNAWDILKEMRKHATDDWVFPSQNGSKSGHVEDLHRPWYALLKRAGIENMRFHDLRRTFGSYQAITGAGSFVLGKALGDKTNAAVRVYARLTMDPIRDSIQRGADKMLEFIRPGQ